MRDSNKFKIRNSTFPEIEEKIVRLLDDADRTGSTLSSKYIRAKALEYAAELKIANFNASKGWLLKLLSRQNRKLGRTVDHLQKRKPFIRLSFGEKHIIAIYIKEHPNKTYPEYAKHFSELWERNVTARYVDLSISLTQCENAVSTVPNPCFSLNTFVLSFESMLFTFKWFCLHHKQKRNFYYLFFFSTPKLPPSARIRAPVHIFLCRLCMLENVAFLFKRLIL